MRSIALPFRFSNGEVAHVSDPHTLVQQRIVSYLTTSAAERFGISDYGFSLYTLLFEPIDDLIKADIKTDVIPGLQKYVTGARIIDMDIVQDPIDDSIVDVHVIYALPLSTSRTFSFSIANDLTEESAI